METASGALLGPTPVRRMFIGERPASSAGRSIVMDGAGPQLAPRAIHPSHTRHCGRAADSNTDGDVSRHDVLIFSTDPLAAALLGAAVELAGHAPTFPQHGEAARVALRRLRPGVALIDCDHQEACSESFIGPALMTGAKVLLFRSGRTTHDARDFARRHGLSIAELPRDHDAFSTLLNELLTTTP
jgi:hypothetical protein